MFISQNALFLYAVSPVHMGAGTALGLIDNPIQREKHTEHPVIAASGLKGAIRHHFWSCGQKAQEKIKRYFGPETNASEYAGAVSFSDAQLVAFPIRCNKEGFIYATSPSAIARAMRLLNHTGNDENWKIPHPNEAECNTIPGCKVKTGDKVQIDAFELTTSDSEQLAVIANYLSQNALPEKAEFEYFREKLKRDLIIINDAEFTYFVKNATLVEPHVAIDNDTGTTKEGSLHYTENLPPESLFIAAMLASDERSKSGHAESTEIMDDLINGCDEFSGLNELLLQVGGDASTGRGQVIVNMVKGGN